MLSRFLANLLLVTGLQMCRHKYICRVMGNQDASLYMNNCLSKPHYSENKIAWIV